MKQYVKMLIMMSLLSLVYSQRTVKPVLHGRHWIAITGKPLGATALLVRLPWRPAEHSASQ